MKLLKRRGLARSMLSASTSHESILHGCAVMLPVAALKSPFPFGPFRTIEVVGWTKGDRKMKLAFWSR